MISVLVSLCTASEAFGERAAASSVAGPVGPAELPSALL